MISSPLRTSSAAHTTSCASCLCTDTGAAGLPTERYRSSNSASGLVEPLSRGLVEQLGPTVVNALAAAYAHPEQQVVQHPTPLLMVLYFKKHLQLHMAHVGLAGTEHMSLLSACSALEAQRTTSTENAVALVAQAMEELRQEAERGEKKTAEQLAWDLARAIAEQHAAQ